MAELNREERRRTYAEWYVWAARNLTPTPEIRHACAEAATEAVAAGTDPAVAARNAAGSRSGPGWQSQADPGIRSYAEWYDWGRTTLNLSGPQLHSAAAAAIAAMESGGNAADAAAAARQAVDAAAPSSAPTPPAAQPFTPPPQPPPPPPPPPAPAAQPAPAVPPPPPAPPPGWVPSSPPPTYGYTSAPAPAPYGQPPYGQTAAGPALVPVWATALLGVGCGLSLLLAVIYAGVLAQTGNSQDVVIGSFVFGGIGLLMFATSLVALIGIIRRAAWGRAWAVVAGVAFCISCVGLLLGVPVIIGAVTARRSQQGTN